MEKITTETPCELCGKGVIRGKMAQAYEGYVCEECCLKLANSDLVEIEATQPAIEGDVIQQAVHPCPKCYHLYKWKSTAERCCS